MKIHYLKLTNQPFVSIKIGGVSKEWLFDQIRQFYTLEDQKKYGVIGIEISLEKESFI